MPRFHFSELLRRLFRKPRPRSAKPRRQLLLEELESRDLPALMQPMHVAYDPGGAVPLSTGGPTGMTPTQIRHAYGTDQVTFDGGTVAGNGAGTTIAIVDAYDDPNIASDLHNFDLAFNLPDPPSFTKVNQTGGSTYPAANSGWITEIALDVEWSHAVAPDANILLVEANDNTDTNLYAAVQYAAAQPGVVVVSMSWGGSESSSETSTDSTVFQTPAGHAGVTFVAASGDSGAPPIYPAASPNVVAVGGTTLNVDASGDYISETAWNSDGGSSGGGISSVEPQPAYQTGVVTQSSSFRTDPDVAYDADPNNGFPVYDTYNNPVSAPWGQWGGTSDAAPQWAALIAIADQGRILSGLGTLDGPSQTLERLYAINSTDFHDITSGGSTGSPPYSAGPGYDLVTGRGTPVTNLIEPLLVASTLPTVSVTAPVSAMAGSPFTITVTARNTSGNISTSYNGTVHFSTTDTGPGAVVPADYTFVPADGGVHVFTAGAILVSAGNQTITAFDTAQDAISAGASVSVYAAAATHLGVSAPSSVLPNTAFSFAVTALDSFGNTATSYTGTVGFTSTDSQALLPSNATLTNGVGKFHATLETLGPQTVTATDSSNGTIAGSAALSVVTSALRPWPFVESINSTTPPGPNTSASSVVYTVTFSEAVTGVAAGDFALVLTGNVTGTVTQVTPVSASVYTVTVGGITGSGTLGLNLVDNGAIRDSAGHGLTQQNAPLTFQTQQTFGAPGGSRSVAIADLNGDGKADLAVASYGSTVAALLGNGNGTFQAQQVFTTGNGPESVAVGDVNGDGIPDLVVANRRSNTVGVLLGNGNGTFQAQQAFATGSQPIFVAVADVNGDGKPDLVVANNIDGNSVSVLLGNGNGTFQNQMVFAAGNQPSSVVVTDLNGDGIPDIVTANYVSGNVSVLLGNGNGTFQNQLNFVTGPHPVEVAVGDVNGDGIPDLVVGSVGTNAIDILLGNGNGTFQAFQSFATTSEPISVALGDMNGDGNLDVVATSLNGGPVSVLLGNGNGTFRSQQTFANGGTRFSVVVGDVNGDGRPDIVFTNTGAGSVGVLLNAANGNFTGQVYTIVNPAVPTHFVVSAAPASITAGSSATLTVTAEDQFGDLSFAYTGTIHFSTTDTGSGVVLPSDYTFVPGDSGMHVFTSTTTLVTAGSQTVTATDTTTVGITGTTALTVNPDAPGLLMVSAGSAATSGTVFSVTVTATDHFGNRAPGYLGTVHFTSTDAGAGAQLPLDYTFVPADSSVHVFTDAVILVTLGKQTVTATDTTAGSITGSTAVVVYPPANQLIVNAATAAIAGNPFSVTVTAMNTFLGDIVTDYTGTVRFSTTDGGSGVQMPTNYTFVAGDDGVHTFTGGVILVSAGRQTVTATDTTTSSITGSAALTVNPASAVQLTVSAGPTAVAGSAFSVTVTAKDHYGNIATGYVGTVHFTKTDSGSGAQVPADYTFAAGDSGMHLFINTMILVTAGSQTVTATDTTTSSIAGSTALTVNPGAAIQLMVSAASPETGGAAFSVTVTAMDHFDNSASGYLGTVHFTSTDAGTGAQLPLDYTFRPADSGEHVFTNAVILVSSGTRTVTATDTITSSITGSTAVLVNLAPVSQLIVSTSNVLSAGTPFSITVTATNTLGTTNTNYTGTVHFSTTDGGSGVQLPANYTFVAGDDGVHTFANSVTLVTAGRDTLTAADTNTSSISGSAVLTVNPASAVQLIVSAPTTTAAGSAFSVTVTAKDHYGNTATGYVGTVHFTNSDSGSGAQVPADYTFVAGDSGVHTFASGVILVTIGSQTVTAADKTTASITGSAVLSVSQGGATHFTVSAASTQTAGTPFSITVTAKDQFGNTASGYKGVVAFLKSDVGIDAVQTVTFNGGPTGGNFALIFGGQTTTNISFSTPSAALASSIQTALNALPSLGTGNTVVSAVSANSVAVTFQGPLGGAPVAAMTVKNGLLGGSNASVAVATTQTGVSASVPATYSFSAADGGVHVFNNGVTLVSAPAGPTVQTVTVIDINAGTITGNTAVTVIAATAKTLTVTLPASLGQGLAAAVTVTARDTFGNVVTGYLGTVHFATSDPAAQPPVVLPADYAFVPGDNGQHVFTNDLTLFTAGNQTVTVSDRFSTTVTGSFVATVIGAAKTFTVTAPASTTAGNAFTITVTAGDAVGNIAVNYTGTVHFTTSDPAAEPPLVLPADYAFLPGDQGQHVFTGGVTLISAGPQTLTATDTVSSSVTGTASLTVLPAAATLEVSGQASATAGAALTVTVAAEDIYGNSIPGYLGTVRFTTSDSAIPVVHPGNYTFVAGDSGQHVFTSGVTLVTAGPQIISATDTVSPTVSGQCTVTVIGAAARTLVITAPSSTTAGNAFNVTVTARDTFGNIAIAYSGTAHFSTSDPAAQPPLLLPANWTFLASDSGQHVFSGGASLVTAGTQTITATDTTTGTIIGSATVSVQPAAPAALLVTAPLTATAGVAFGITVTAKDSFGNTVPNYLGTVHFSKADSSTGSFVPADYTFTAGDAGVHTFNNAVIVIQTGSQIVTATDTGSSTVTGSVAVTMNYPTTATSFTVTGPATTSADSAWPVTVTALNVLNQVCTFYRGTVEFTKSDPGTAAAVPLDYAFTASDNGVHVFSVGAILVTAGSQTITATDIGNSTLSGASTVTVNPLAASHLLLSAPNVVSILSPVNLTVTAEDAYDNTATSYLGTVRFSTTDTASGVAVPVNFTFVPGDHGQHIFTNGLALKTAGPQTVTATDTVSSSVTGATQTTVPVSIFIPDTLSGSPGGIVTVPIDTSALNSPDSGQEGLSNGEFTVYFNPALFTVSASDVNVGTLATNGSTQVGEGFKPTTTPGVGTNGWTARATLLATGEIHVSLSAASYGIVTDSASGSMVTINFHILPGASAGPTRIDLAADDATGIAPSTGISDGANFSDYGNAGALFPAPLNNVISVSPYLYSSTPADPTDGTVTVLASPATHFSVTAPASTSAGTPLVVTVHALDSFNNVATGYSGTVHLGSTDPQADLPGDATLTNGIGYFVTYLATVGNQFLTAQDTVSATISGTSQAITTSAAAASHFAVAVGTTTTAGVSLSFTVTALDRFGNTVLPFSGTVHFSSSDGHAVLPGDTTLVNGVGNFDAVLETAGLENLTATDAAAGLTGTGIVTVAAAGATHFAVTGPTSTTAGNAFLVSVTAEDSFGNTATNYSGIVHFSSTDTSAVLPADTTLTLGIGTVAAVLSTAGNATITATDSAAGIAGTSNPITVLAAAVSRFTIAANGDATAGAAFNLTVTAIDAFGNTASAYAGTVHVASSDSRALLGGNVTLAGGTGVFSVTFETAGSQTLTVADVSNANLTGSAKVGVGAAAAERFAVSAPAFATAGSVFLLTVAALDSFSNLAVQFSSTVHFTSSDGKAVLPADATLTAGIGYVPATLKTAGTQTLTANDGMIAGTSAGVTVGAAAVSHFVVTAPGSATAGSAFNVTVTAQDPFGNAVPTDDDTVQFASSDGAAVLPGSGPLVDGAATFSVTLLTPGNQTVTASDAAAAGISGNTSINVAAGAVTHFAVSTAAATPAGNPIVFLVKALDQSNNIASSFSGTVHFASSDNQASLPADTTLTAGIGYFGATPRTAGSQFITAAATVPGPSAGTSAAVTVTALAANHYALSVPASAITGTPFSFTVTAEDPFNNIAGTDNDTVNFTSSDQSAHLPGSVALQGGSGTYQATLMTPGGQTITATDTGAGSSTGTSSPITTRGLVVTRLTPTASGFVATFSQPFDASQINLYDFEGDWGPDDVLLTTVGGGQTSLKGSLIIDPSDQTITFVKTSTFTGVGYNPSTGVLSPGTYIVTLRSASNGFIDLLGDPLDGLNDGNPAGSNFVTTFVVTGSPDVIGLPAFARGPNSAAAVNLPNSSTTAGIPINVSNGSGVTSGTFTLEYNPSLLSINGAFANTALAGATMSLDAQSTPGTAIIDFSTGAALGSGVQRLGGLVATVPNSTTSSYKAKALLHWSGETLDNGAIAVVGADAVQVIAYFGDVLGTGQLSGGGSSQITRVGLGLDNNSITGTVAGFSAFPLLDPAIIGNLSTSGGTNSADVTLINSVLAGTAHSQIPPIPTALTVTASGPDPTLSLPAAMQATPGGTIIVPVDIDTAHPAGSSGMLEAILALQYDPQFFTVSAADVRLGNLPSAAAGWQLTTVVNDRTGEIGIDLFGTTPIETTAGGSLVLISLTDTAMGQMSPMGPVPALNLVWQVDPTGARLFRTTVSDGQGAFVLGMVGGGGWTVKGTENASLAAAIGPRSPATDFLEQALADLMPMMVQEDAPGQPGTFPYQEIDDRTQAAAYDQAFLQPLGIAQAEHVPAAMLTDSDQATRERDRVWEDLMDLDGLC